jgi:radical SAM superfamily enzyme YgiQ (UPF0313 family)
MSSNTNTFPNAPGHSEKILLALLPFWSPLIPPIGIASLKTHLQPNDYHVKTVDAAIEKRFLELYYQYFDLLKQGIPVEKQGNFYSIGHDILRNQMMATLNFKDESAYKELIKDLIYKTFYSDAPDPLILELKKIIDEFYVRLESYFLDLLEREKPTVLGLTVYSDTLASSLFAFKLAKEKYPHIKTYMGGGVFADQLAPASPNWEVFLEKTGNFIDKIIIGEGEILLLKSLRGELPISQRVYNLKDINGEILDLKTVDILDLSDFDISNYPYNISYTSRSCPFQCSFCSETIQWGAYRKKSAEQIFKEVRKLYEKHHYQLFIFSDSLLNPVIKEITEEFLKADIVIYWSGWLRVDKYSAEMENAFKWRRSGFYHARMGIESGSQHVLDLMNKKVSVEQAKESIANLASAGIKTTTLWVVGHPGETEEDFQKTLDFIDELKYDIYEAECRPFYYYLTGQAGSLDNHWNNLKPICLYPKKYTDMLMFQTWILDSEPSREETYSRVNRFVQHCRNLGIPNPYSMHEIYEADERWKKLHNNAVPSLLEFKKRDYLDECRSVKELLTVSNLTLDIEEFDF